MDHRYERPSPNSLKGSLGSKRSTKGSFVFHLISMRNV